MTADDAFFRERSDESLVKSTIVAKYFLQWARVMLGAVSNRPSHPDGRIAYIDLFAGPGRYDDGAASTPLIILRQAIQNPQIARRLVTLFNDRRPAACSSLRANIEQLAGHEKLVHTPIVTNMEVGPDIARRLDDMDLPPTLLFVDPWGYKGLTLDLVNSVLKRWGCDCILFFNYNRINSGLSNPMVREHMEALFGPQQADVLSRRLARLSPSEREATIVEGLADALRSVNGKYVLPFCFKNEHGTRSSHHLVFVSKHFRGYEIMKSIMAAQSSAIEQNVASFTYCPATKRQPALFKLNQPLDDLAEMLVSQYEGRAMAVRHIYEDHSVGTPFTSSNYKDVLRRLEAEGRVAVDPPAPARRKNTLKDAAIVTFPGRSH